MRTIIGIYDERGRRVKTLARGEREPGKHLLEWDGTTDGGARVPSGIYFFQVEMEGKGVVAKFKIVIR